MKKGAFKLRNVVKGPKNAWEKRHSKGNASKQTKETLCIVDIIWSRKIFSTKQPLLSKRFVFVLILVNCFILKKILNFDFFIVFKMQKKITNESILD